MQLTVLTPHRKLIENVEVDELIVPGHFGTLDILKGHADFVTPLVTGIMKWKHGSEWTTAAISHGILEIFQENISVMVDVSEMGPEIDVNRAKKSRDVARQKIEEGGLDDVNFRKYELKMKRAMARLNVSGEE